SLFLPSQNIPSCSPLHASDTGIDAENNHRNICQFATLKHFHKGRYIGKGGGPYPRANKMFCAISFQIVHKFAPWLFGPGEIFPVRHSFQFHFDLPFWHLFNSLPDQINGTEKFTDPDSATGITIPG